MLNCYKKVAGFGFFLPLFHLCGSILICRQQFAEKRRARFCIVVRGQVFRAGCGVTAEKYLSVVQSADTASGGTGR